MKRTRSDAGTSEARKLSYRALDIEQIGHVYEGLLDHVALPKAHAIFKRKRRGVTEASHCAARTGSLLRRQQANHHPIPELVFCDCWFVLAKILFDPALHERIILMQRKE